MRISDWSSDVALPISASGNARNHLLLQPRNSLKEAVGHVAWEEARRNGIDVDPLRREVGSKHTGQLVNARLCCVIRVGAIGTTAQDGANGPMFDTRRGTAGLERGFHLGQQAWDEKERSTHI